MCRTALVLLTLAVALINTSVVKAGKPNPPATPPPVKYTVKVIAPMNSFAGMNNRGDIVGGNRLYDSLTDATYDAATPIEELLPAGSIVNEVMDINDNWQVAGNFVDSQGAYRTFRCSLGYGAAGISATALQILAEPSGFIESHVAAIDKQGNIVGMIQTDLGYFAALWPGTGGMIFLDDVESDAYAISDIGNVTGRINPFPQQHAFLYNASTGITTDLKTLRRRTKSFGNGVNDSGQVVGSSSDPSYQHAFRYTPGVGMVDLGVMSGDLWSFATSINNAGQTVGLSVNHVSSSRNHPFLHTDANKMMDIMTLIASGPAIAYLEPRAINNYPAHAFGQIAGTALVDGVTRVVLLTPVTPVP